MGRIRKNKLMPGSNFTTYIPSDTDPEIVNYLNKVKNVNRLIMNLISEHLKKDPNAV